MLKWVTERVLDDFVSCVEYIFNNCVKQSRFVVFVNCCLASIVLVTELECAGRRSANEILPLTEKSS